VWCSLHLFEALSCSAFRFVGYLASSCDVALKCPRVALSAFHLIYWHPRVVSHFTFVLILHLDILVLMVPPVEVPLAMFLSGYPRVMSH